MQVAPNCLKFCMTYHIHNLMSHTKFQLSTPTLPKLLPWLDLLVSLVGAVVVSSTTIMLPAIMDTAGHWQELAGHWQDIGRNWQELAGHWQELAGHFLVSLHGKPLVLTFWQCWSRELKFGM